MFVLHILSFWPLQLSFTRHRCFGVVETRSIVPERFAQTSLKWKFHHEMMISVVRAQMFLLQSSPLWWHAIVRFWMRTQAPKMILFIFSTRSSLRVMYPWPRLWIIVIEDWRVRAKSLARWPLHTFCSLCRLLSRHFWRSKDSRCWRQNSEAYYIEILESRKPRLRICHSKKTLSKAAKCTAEIPFI